jgi:ribosomal protein S18 acetylase RimI-like enzyme
VKPAGVLPPHFLPLQPGFDPALLSRIEDAGLNASAPPQQRWLDGWLVRFNPGKAQRARCINALAEGRRALPAKLEECAALYAATGLPMLVRVTPFSRPADLDVQLAGAGYAPHDETRVMVRIGPPPRAPALEETLEWLEGLGPGDFAQVAGALRASPAAERAAHAERLRGSPVTYRGAVIRERTGGAPLACGQVAVEGPLVGLYDVVTAPSARRRGLANTLCRRLLAQALGAGAQAAYLQVGADNEAARRIYSRLGFVDAYGYHYRVAPA